MKKKEIINSKKFYAFNVYRPTKNAVPVTYKGTKYLSKAQCMALEGITRKELDEYIKSEVEAVSVMPDKAITLDDTDTINDLNVFNDHEL